MRRVGVLVALALVLVPVTGAAHGVRTRPAAGGVAVGPRAGRPFGALVRAPRSVFPGPVDPWKSWPPRAAAPRARHPRIVPFGGVPLVSSTLVVPGSYAPVLVTTAPGGVYAVPPAAPGPPPAPPAPPPPPVPALVEHDDGWYQLRGDGGAEPYRWVWIPKPPPTAPSMPSAPGVAPAPGAERGAREPGVAYHWTDEGGVTTWTNRLDRIPKRYRDRAVESARPD